MRPPVGLTINSMRPRLMGMKAAGNVFENLPTDGASQHDHYIYGVRKRREA